MALYDNYFTNEDKPFAENLNDALLLSNVFDMTVNVEAPKMFSNKTWVNTTSPRKCSVSILTLKEGLPSGVSVGTDSETGNSTLTGTGTVKLRWYPNFNSFGKFKSISWESEGNVTVNLKTSNGVMIASNISKGIIENQSSELRTLQEIVIELVLNNATLKSVEVIMENKQTERYGAEVGIDDVNGLDTILDDTASTLSNLENKVNTTEFTSVYAETEKCNISCNVRRINGFMEVCGIFNTPSGGSRFTTVSVQLPTEYHVDLTPFGRYFKIGINNYTSSYAPPNQASIHFNGDSITAAYTGTLVTHYFYGLIGLMDE